MKKQISVNGTGIYRSTTISGQKAIKLEIRNKI